MEGGSLMSVSCSVQEVKRAKRGYVTVFLRFRRADGTQGKEKIGRLWERKGRPPTGHLTKDQAKAACRRKMVELEDERPAASGGKTTFGEVMTEFLRYVREVREVDPKTSRDYEGVINGYLLEEFGADTPAEDIDADAIEEYRDRLMRDDELSNRTIVRHLTVLNGAFKRAERKWPEQVKTNPAAANMVERPKVVYTGEFDTFTRDEVELAATLSTEQDAALIRVAAYTGLRQGELLALRWSRVDFITGLLHVKRNYTGGEEKIPKGKRVRSVPMMPDVVTALAKLKERENFTGDNDLVFVNETGEHLSHFELRRRFYRTLKKAGLRKIRFHDLRHAFGTATIATLDPHSVQSYMGHKHFTTTQRYLHHKPKASDAAKIATDLNGPEHVLRPEGLFARRRELDR
jgi:integrase